MYVIISKSCALGARVTCASLYANGPEKIPGSDAVEATEGIRLQVPR
jgi:hypothetical protein